MTLVGITDTTEVVAVHNTLEPLTFGSADDIDERNILEDVLNGA